MCVCACSDMVARRGTQRVPGLDAPIQTLSCHGFDGARLGTPPEPGIVALVDRVSDKVQHGKSAVVLQCLASSQTLAKFFMSCDPTADTPSVNEFALLLKDMCSNAFTVVGCPAMAALVRHVGVGDLLVQDQASTW